jgi:hypothetical protein
MEFLGVYTNQFKLTQDIIKRFQNNLLVNGDYYYFEGVMYMFEDDQMFLIENNYASIQTTTDITNHNILIEQINRFLQNEKEKKNIPIMSFDFSELDNLIHNFLHNNE